LKALPYFAHELLVIGRYGFDFSEVAGKQYPGFIDSDEPNSPRP
jgi:hypothetical protein